MFTALVSIAPDDEATVLDSAAILLRVTHLPTGTQYWFDLTPPGAEAAGGS
ncbi:MAG: hypothetical protein PVI35_04965 [Acidimicrobiia bacterium]